MRDEKYPLPGKALNLLYMLKVEGRLSKEEIEVFSEVILLYLDLRVEWAVLEKNATRERSRK